MNVDDLTSKWWTWWGTMQPEERGDSFDRVSGSLDWDRVNIAGINGIVSVVASLLWWGLVTSEDDLAGYQEWLEAVDDVSWALECAGAGDVEADDDDDEIPTMPATKKRKYVVHYAIFDPLN